MSDLRIAVLGLGMMGAFHVDLLTSSIKGASVTVVNDFVPTKAEEVAARIGARVVADPIGAINDPEVDAVLLATPGSTHFEQVTACLDAGKPVLCEKPLTTDVATSYEIVQKEAALGRRLVQVGLHAPLRRGVRRTRGADPLRWARQGPDAALHPPQPGGAGPLQLRVHDQGLGRARGRRHPFPARTRRSPASRYWPEPATAAAPEGTHDPMLVVFETAAGRAGHRRDLRPHRDRVRGADRGRRASGGAP